MGTLIFIVVVTALYLLPTILVLKNDKKVSKAPVIIVNIFFGWTFIGWIACVAWSLSKDIPTVVINNNNGKSE